MSHETITRPTLARGIVRTLRQQEELPLLRDHLLRLDPESRHDRFHGFMDDSFIERYAAKCADDGTVIIAYIEDGVVRGAAELHPPDQSPDSLPEIAFSVEARGAPAGRRQHPVQEADRGSARQGLPLAADHHRRAERGDAGARPQVRRESVVPPRRIHRNHRSDAAGAGPSPRRSAIATPADAARAMARVNRAYWQMLLRMYGWGRAA